MFSGLPHSSQALPESPLRASFPPPVPKGLPCSPGLHHFRFSGVPLFSPNTNPFHCSPDPRLALTLMSPKGTSRPRSDPAADLEPQRPGPQCVRTADMRAAWWQGPPTPWQNPWDTDVVLAGSRSPLLWTTDRCPREAGSPTSSPFPPPPLGGSRPLPPHMPVPAARTASASRMEFTCV